MNNRRDKFDLTNLSFPNKSSLYFNDNLCPYYKHLAFMCRKLKLAKIVKFVWSDNGTVKLKRDESSRTLKITHLNDLLFNFPDFDFSDSGYSG